MDFLSIFIGDVFYYITSPYFPFCTSPRICPSTSVTTRRRMMLTYRLACVAMITVVPLRFISVSM